MQKKMGIDIYCPLLAIRPPNSIVLRYRFPRWKAVMLVTEVRMFPYLFTVIWYSSRLPSVNSNTRSKRTRSGQPWHFKRRECDVWTEKKTPIVMFFHKWFYMALCMITLVSCTPIASPQDTKVVDLTSVSWGQWVETPGLKAAIDPEWIVTDSPSEGE